MTQSVAIKKYLESGKSLTTMQGFKLFGCTKTGNRINEMHQDGKLPGLKKEMVEVKTRQGKTRVMKYCISKK